MLQYVQLDYGSGYGSWINFLLKVTENRAARAAMFFHEQGSYPIRIAPRTNTHIPSDDPTCDLGGILCTRAVREEGNCLAALSISRLYGEPPCLSTKPPT